MSGTHSPKKPPFFGGMQMHANEPFGWGRRISPPTGCLGWKQSHRRGGKEEGGRLLGLLNISFPRREFSWAHILKGCSEAAAGPCQTPEITHKRHGPRGGWAASALCWAGKRDLGLVKAALLMWTREQSKKNLRLFQQQPGWCLWKPSGGHKTMRTFLWLRSFRFVLLLLVDLGEKKWEEALFLKEQMCFRSSGFLLPAVVEWGAANSWGLPVCVWTVLSVLFHELKDRNGWFYLLYSLEVFG